MTKTAANKKLCIQKFTTSNRSIVSKMYLGYQSKSTGMDDIKRLLMNVASNFLISVVLLLELL